MVAMTNSLLGHGENDASILLAGKISMMECSRRLHTIDYSLAVPPSRKDVVVASELCPGGVNSR